MMDFETKFRAFQLDSPGSLFSYYKPDEYTLIEARIPHKGIETLWEDLKLHGKEFIDTLHITSWDTDHCNFDDLTQIINRLRPQRIEIPCYIPESEDAKLCRGLLLKYDHIHQKYVHNVFVIDKKYIGQLPYASALGTNDVVYESMYDCECKNDMSLIKLFRSAGFNVISLGDCECEDIANELCTRSFIKTEIDILILPHHGAHNGFITNKFLKTLKPRIAICSSNHGNQYDHPRQEIRDLLYFNSIPLFTTKTGDIIIFQRKESEQANLVNLLNDNTKLGAETTFVPKRLSKPLSI